MQYLFKFNKLTIKLKRFFNDRVFNRELNKCYCTIQRQSCWNNQNDVIPSSTEDIQIFKSYYSDFVKELTESDPRISKLDLIAQRYKKCLNWNANSSRKIRGTYLLSVYKSLEKPENLTEENIKLACVLGWGTEIMTASRCIMDDISDNSITRRGFPCWHTLDDIGLTAVNDMILLEQGVYYLIKKHLNHHPYYINMMDTIKHFLTTTTIGQILDSTKHSVDNFTWDLYYDIADYKALYFGCEPIVLALYLTKISNKQTHQDVPELMIDCCRFFQEQNDFLDVYGDVHRSGKIGTDIQCGKITWVSTNVMTSSDEHQKDIMRKHYGKWDEEDVKKIKNLYDELNIQERFRQHKQNLYDSVVRKVKLSNTKLPKHIVLNWLVASMNKDHIEIKM